MTEINENELAEWERLANEATPGEWFVTNPDDDCFMNAFMVTTQATNDDLENAEKNIAVTLLQTPRYVANNKYLENASFIVASRTAVPRLIAEVKRLKHAAKSWEKEADINNDVAQQQQNRAERAEAENARLREALEKIALPIRDYSEWVARTNNGDHYAWKIAQDALDGKDYKTPPTTNS